VNNVTNPNYFVSTFVNKKEIATIIPTLQMSQATSSMKSKVEIVFDVGHLNLAPRIAIILSVLYIYPK
jgi:hypothetical protein